jgi:hypothetical protein
MARRNRKVRSKKQHRRWQPSAEMRERALHALSLMRADRFSLARASKEIGMRPMMVRRYVGVALAKASNGRYRAKPLDRLRRELNFLTEEGQILIVVHSSKTASLIGHYWAAVNRYLKTGDVSGIEEFRSKAIKAGSKRYVFVTDPHVLKRLGNAGELSIEHIYATNY